VRIGKGSRIRIRAAFGTAEFDAEYQAALSSKPRVQKGAPALGTLAWLIDRYRNSTDWSALSLATRRQRENIFKQVIGSAGTKAYAKITEATIAEGRDRRSMTPFQARHFLFAMRGLFAWAKGAGLARIDPAASVSLPELKNGEGFPVWSEEEVAAYEQYWPLGTKERLWFAMLLYTGLRRGDAVRLGRQHVRNGVATLTTEKTGTEVYIRILPPLLEAIEAGPTGDLAFICGANRKPLTKESFGNQFAEACRKAGIRKSAHGLRKLAATTMANNGATVAELNSIFGWTGARMASRYTERADRKKLSSGAAEKLMNEERTSIPAPSDKVRARAEKH
jgi:integrase